MEAIGHAILERSVPVKYAFVPDLLEQFRESYVTEGETSEDIYRRHQRAEVLLLDDITEKRVTPLAADVITRLVDERYRTERPLVVSTNLSMEVMGREDLWGPRLADRLFDDTRATVVYFQCESYRTGKKWPSPMAAIRRAVRGEARR